MCSDVVLAEGTTDTIAVGEADQLNLDETRVTPVLSPRVFYGDVLSLSKGAIGVLDSGSTETNSLHGVVDSVIATVNIRGNNTRGVRAPDAVRGVSSDRNSLASESSLQS